MIGACGGSDGADRAAPAATQAAAAAPDTPGAPPPVTVRADLAAPAPDSLAVAWTFAIPDGWHLYADRLNDSGFPPSVDLTLPAGWAAGPLRWPVPERHVLPGEILDHVYVHRLVLLQDLTPPGAARPAAPATITAKVRWLACREACVPGQAVLTVTVPGAGAALPAAFADPPPFPAPLPPGLVAASRHGDIVTFRVPGARALRFFPDPDSGPYRDLVADGEAAGDRLDLRLRPRDGAIGPVRGLLQIDRADGTRLTGPVAAADTADTADTAETGGTTP